MRNTWTEDVFFESLMLYFPYIHPFPLGGPVQGDQSFPFRLPATSQAGETEVLGGR